MIGAGTVKSDKLTDSSFHIWKQKMNFIITYREVAKVIDWQNRYEKETIDRKNWV